MSNYNSGYQPTITMGIPGNERMNRAMMWAGAAVAIVFFVSLMIFGVKNADDGTTDEGALAPAAASEAVG